MHEMSLVQSLLRQVKRIAAEHESHRVLEIRVEAGPLSGVEALLVHEAYQRLQRAPLADDPQSTVDLSDAQLLIEDVPLSACCNGCGMEFNIAHFAFVCPACGAVSLRMIRGDTFRLLTVTLADVVESAEVDA